MESQLLADCAAVCGQAAGWSQDQVADFTSHKDNVSKALQSYRVAAEELLDTIKEENDPNDASHTAEDLERMGWTS